MITPSRGYCLIEPEQAESKTKDGLYLPDSGQDKPMKGTVIEIGNDSYPTLVPHPQMVIRQEDFKKGDKVYFKKWSGESIKDEDRELVFIPFSDILGVISE